MKEQYGQATKINDHTRQVVASALLDIHASLNRDLQAQTRIISTLINQAGQMKNEDKVAADIRQRSFGCVTTADDVQLYSDIQRSEAQLHQATVELVIESLYYETITQRYEAVIEAHQKTFEWIFRPMGDENDSNAMHWSDFVQWLRQGEGIYWINGKAGSGKSTLMKYICENPKTQEHLGIWAGKTPLHTAMFFFWWGGTKLQKSQDGLIRSLLYDVLSQVPELIPHVVPSEYALTYAANTNISKAKRVRAPFPNQILFSRLTGCGSLILGLPHRFLRLFRPSYLNVKCL